MSGPRSSTASPRVSPISSTCGRSRTERDRRLLGPAGGQKLGLKPEATVVLIDAPDSTESLLEPLPDGVAVRRESRGGRDMTIWFVTSRRQFERRFDAVARAVGEGTLWMAWPKRSSERRAA